MKSLQTATLVASLLALPGANAAMLAVEAGVMDWGSKAENYFGDAKSSNPFIKIKAATGSEFGDIYGHFVLEDFDDSDLMGSEINVIGQINMGQTDFNWYGQIFSKTKPNWSETNTLLGFSHDKTWDNGIYTQVAVAGHIVTSDYQHFGFDVNGFNGGYAYFGIDKTFAIADSALKLLWWQEHYFGRDDDYLIVAGDGEDHGFNGKLEARYFIGDTGLSAALAYRYAENNMGKQGYHDAIFYSMQYNF
ncbi:hypothetical protein [Ferrimonas lipolytica]|uniref:Nucleoside-specific channel-forming protein, Tsx n=1 Tax=Ferrimonas lipolytica TaxID=2724191 RepID=A0A6H1UH39_9GAMM|nr:hypothetical protein [Ferrimonas lipolytica]QIZ78138.1 hypothetical protein HER31_15245 [Ferrimonas lipolytica]